MLFHTLAWDLKLQILFNQHWRAPILDFMAPLLSSPLVLWGFALFVCLALSRRYGAKTLLFLLLLVAAAGISDFTTKQVKHAFGRVRPLNDIPGTYFHEDGQWQRRPPDFVRTKERGSSYFSAHAATSMTVAFLAFLLWPATRSWVLLLPLAVGWSRLYLGKHYPTDVLAGFLWGIVLAFLIHTLVRAALSARAGRKSIDPETPVPPAGD